MAFKALGKWRYPILIAALTVIIIALLMATKPEAPTQPSTEKSWQVSAVSAERINANPEVELYARTESPHEAKLSTTVASDVTALHALPGQSVKKGDVIIELDDTDAQIALMQAEADLVEFYAVIESEHIRYETDQRALKSEQRMLKIAQDALARQAKLQESNLVAKERSDNAESALAQSELMIAAREQSIKDHPSRLKKLNAGLKRTKARLQAAQRDLEKTQVKAPFDAHITAVLVAPGDRVQPGQNLVELFDHNRVELRVQIPNNLIDDIESALTNEGEVTARGNGHQFKVARLSLASSQQHGGRDAWLVPVDPDLSLPLNKSLRVILELPAQQNLIALPISSIYGTDRVFRIRDERLESLVVQPIGYHYQDGAQDKVLVSSDTINDGDQIITTQLPKAINGLKVTLQGSTK